MNKSISLLTSALFLCLSLNSFAQVDTYGFLSFSGSYTEITGDTTVAFATGITPLTPESMDEAIYQNNTLPFSFIFNGISHANVVISSNGFITFGGLPPYRTVRPISDTTVYNGGAVAGIGEDLIGNRWVSGTKTAGSNILTNVPTAHFVGLEIGRVIGGFGIPIGTLITGLNSVARTITLSANATASSSTTIIFVASGSIVRGTTGGNGNRIHTIQFRNMGYAGVNSNCLNFQIKLYETINIIEIVYGTNTVSEIFLAEVGLRGSTNADFNNRTTSTNWATTTAGETNSEICWMTPTVLPSSGLTFKWTPTASLVNNVGVLAITNPLSGINALISTPIAPKATINNFGTANQTSPFNITCTINPGGYSSTKSDTLSAGLTHDIRFDSTFVPIVGTSYTITVYTSLIADINRSNDTLRHDTYFIFQNYGNDSGYFYGNNLATNQSSYPTYSWKDTTGSKNLVLNGIQASGTTLWGSLDDGYFKLSLKNILLSLNQDTTNKHFKYNGICFDSLFPGTNGIIGFTEKFGATSLLAFQIDGNRVPRNALLPFWKDFDLAAMGIGTNTNRLSYKSTGSELIITYDRAVVFSSVTDWVSYQVIIGIVTGCGSANSNFRYTYADTTTGQTSSSFVKNYLSGNDSILSSSTIFRNFVIGFSKNSAPIVYAGYVSSGNPFPASPQTQLAIRRPVYNFTTKRGLAVEFGPNQNSLNEYDGLILNLSVALEGFQSNPPTRVRDTISITLRDGSAPPYTIIHESNVYLDSASTGPKKFGRAYIPLSFLERSNPYYIVIKHRNSVASWSNSISISGDTLSYDFTLGVGQTCGNNAVLINTTASFYTGDVNQDGIVDVSDAGLIDNDAFNFTTGNYLVTDLNWDGIVDIADASLADNNSFNFIAEVKPPGALLVNRITKVYDYKEPTQTIVLPDPYLIGRNKKDIERK